MVEVETPQSAIIDSGLVGFVVGDAPAGMKSAIYACTEHAPPEARRSHRRRGKAACRLMAKATPSEEYAIRSAYHNAQADLDHLNETWAAYRAEGRDRTAVETAIKTAERELRRAERKARRKGVEL